MPTQKNFTTVFQNDIFKIEEYDIHFENGIHKRFSKMTKTDSVFVVPIDNQGNIYFIREYNAAINKYILAYPGGKIDNLETPENAAHRELKEEIGCSAKTLKPLHSFCISPSYIQQTTYAFMATDLSLGQPNNEAGEDLKLEPHHFSEIDELIENGNLIEARDIAASLLVKSQLNSSLSTETSYKDFNTWNHLKQNLHYKEKLAPLFKQGEVWWTSIGLNIGYEEDGKHAKSIRPVLIIRKFNKYMFLGVPLSTKLKNNPFYIPISIKGETVSALISQIRVYSANRLQDKLVDLDSKDTETVKKSIGDTILFSPPPKRGSRG